MSAENVDLVQRFYAGQIFEEGLHPDVEWHSCADLPDSDVYRGIDAVRAFIEDWLVAFDGFRFDIGEVVDKGDYVIAPMVLHGRLKASDQQVTTPVTHVLKIRDGKVIEVREYGRSKAALQAVSASIQSA